MILAAAGQELTEQQLLVGMMLTPFLPVTGAVMMSRAEASADLVVKLAERDPRFAAVLERYLAVSTWAQLGTIVATWSIAVAVDLGRIPADSMIAERLIGQEIATVIEANRARELRRQQEEAASGGGSVNGKPSGGAAAVRSATPWASPADVGGA